MPRAANDVMQSIIFSAVLEGIAALKQASGGLPNQLLRDVQAIHPNVTFADLPKELQDQLAESTRAAFTSASGRATAAARRAGRRKTSAAGDVHSKSEVAAGSPEAAVRSADGC